MIDWREAAARAAAKGAGRCVLLVRHGERLAGRPSASSDFESIEGEDEEIAAKEIEAFMTANL